MVLKFDNREIRSFQAIRVSPGPPAPVGDVRRIKTHLNRPLPILPADEVAVDPTYKVLDGIGVTKEKVPTSLPGKSIAEYLVALSSYLNQAGSLPRAIAISLLSEALGHSGETFRTQIKHIRAVLERMERKNPGGQITCTCLRNCLEHIQQGKPLVGIILK